MPAPLKGALVRETARRGSNVNDVAAGILADEFGLEVGNEYTLDFFFAERHTLLSNFRVETSIDCFIPVPVG